jgi:hypothetical protein
MKMGGLFSLAAQARPEVIAGLRFGGGMLSCRHADLRISLREM